MYMYIDIYILYVYIYEYVHMCKYIIYIHIYMYIDTNVHIYTYRYIYNKYIAAFLFCNAAVSLPVVLKSICGADECHQIFSGADEYQWC